MGIDILLLNPDKGGNLELVKESQKRRFASEKLVEDVLEQYREWVKLSFQKSQIQKQINAVQKEIGAKMKAKEDATELKQKKVEFEKELAGQAQKADSAEAHMRTQTLKIGNIVHDSVPVSDNEDNNRVERFWHPDGLTPNGDMTKPLQGAGLHQKEKAISHDQIMMKLDMLEMDRGAKVAGHRGYYLVNDGVDLNHALIQYGLDFLRKKSYKKVMPPFFMTRHMMAKTAQLEEFDEALYKIEGQGEDNEKYLIATSEQPISAMHSDEWFDKPSEQLPIRYAGYSTCFRKEAGSAGRDVMGVFRVHQFEKVEQFCITEPEQSWAMFEEMVANSEEFYQSLKLPYQVVSIVSGALNNAAAKKYDIEMWFPSQGAYKELVSVSNCTDYQSRALDVRCGAKKVQKGEQNLKAYVHMLNGTLCATERALCCIVENYQTPEGLVVPEPLRPYMGGRDFLPYVRELRPSEKKSRQL